MEPALTFTVTAAVLLALALAADVLAGTAAMLVSAERLLTPRVRAILGAAVLGVVTLAALRSPDARAAMAPPSERILRVAGEAGSSAPRQDDGATESVNAVARRPATYEVMPGDCLWRIARSILQQAGRSPSGAEISDLWKEIYQMNVDVIGPDPNLIHPGQVLAMPQA